MEREIAYMLSIVAAGFVVNFALRALPFALFAGRDRELPRWVERFGKWVSPVIIAALVVYSYAGLAWRTPWPFVAGVLTVALQLWRRNPLVSIVTGTVLYMCLINAGCTTARTIELDAQHPSVQVKTTGVYFGDQPVKVVDVPQILDDAGIPKTRTIHILLDPDVKNLSEARTLMGVLSACGYTRPILVTRRHAESMSIDPAKRRRQQVKTQAKDGGKRVIRYKTSKER